ncbi:MAG: hypothetical protein J1F28_06155 [Oscillospiraceae bacterium]|nr:hypothetical protein [Oscillospiraceae bacterium]
MDNKFPVVRLIICAPIAVAAIVLGTYNVLYSFNYNDIFQSILAAAGMTAIGEIFAALSKFPIISYIISTVICSVALQAITPWHIIITRADFVDMERVFSSYENAVIYCLVAYSAALVVSILFGIFVLHRKDVFNRQK